MALPAVLVGRIVSNLVDKARRNARGATCVEVGYEGQRACVAVDDAGPGVPRTHRERVFTRFWMTDTASPVTGGGLGLALSREYAGSAGGNLTVGESAAGGRPLRPGTPSGSLVHAALTVPRW